MPAAREAFELLKLHPATLALSENAIWELAEVAELLRCAPGHVLFRPHEAVDSIYLIVHGRVKQQVFDLNGALIVERHQGNGGQVGGLAATLGEPAPFQCIVEQPSTLLRIEYAAAVEFSRRHETFRLHFARLMADAARHAILRDKRRQAPQVSAFLHPDETTRRVTQRVVDRLVEIGESPLIITDSNTHSISNAQTCAINEAGQTLAPDEVRRRAAEWLPRGRVLFDVSARLDAEHASRILNACEQVFWCTTAQDWQQSVALLRALLSRAPTLRDKIRIVWMLGAERAAPLAGELRELAHGDVKVHFGNDGESNRSVVFAGVERIVHLLRGLQIGVALGGGAARGMAHLGVLRALEASGITVDMIAGTSAGAMTGTVYSAGFTADFLIRHFVEDLRPSRWFRSLPRGQQWHLLFKYRTGQFDPMLRKYLGVTALEQLYVPMHIVAVDLIGGRDVVRSRGDAVQSIVESINLPLLATPINRDGESLVDGGLINNVPANVLAARGCNFVIAVSVTAKMELEFARNRADTPAGRMRRPSTIQTLLRSFLVQSHNLNATGVQTADLVVEPDVTRFDLSDFGRTAELAAAGEQAMQAALPQLDLLLKQLDPQLFADLPSPPIVNPHTRET